jgi:hypothetical protein
MNFNSVARDFAAAPFHWRLGLGALAHDTIEMRDGTTLTGDIESMSASSVVVRVAGKIQSLDRNLVKRILLVQRETPVEASNPQ